MLTAEPVVRNEDGFWLHSALNNLPENTLIEDLPASEGMKFLYVEFFDDAPSDLRDLYDEATGMSATTDYRDVVRQWDPKTPTGEGWFLVAIYDTEDGPCSCFGRPTSPSELFDAAFNAPFDQRNIKL